MGNCRWLSRGGTAQDCARTQVGVAGLLWGWGGRLCQLWAPHFWVTLWNPHVHGGVGTARPLPRTVLSEHCVSGSQGGSGAFQVCVVSASAKLPCPPWPKMLNPGWSKRQRSECPVWVGIAFGVHYCKQTYKQVPQVWDCLSFVFGSLVPTT